MVGLEVVEVTCSSWGTRVVGLELSGEIVSCSLAGVALGFADSETVMGDWLVESLCRSGAGELLLGTPVWTGSWLAGAEVETSALVTGAVPVEL